MVTWADKNRVLGSLLVVEGALLATLAIWKAWTWLPELLSSPVPAVLVLLLLTVALLSLMALAATVTARGWRVTRHGQRSATAAGLQVQPLVLAVFLTASILDTDPWLVGLGAGIGVVTSGALVLALAGARGRAV